MRKIEWISRHDRARKIWEVIEICHWMCAPDLSECAQMYGITLWLQFFFTPDNSRKKVKRTNEINPNRNRVDVVSVFILDGLHWFGIVSKTEWTEKWEKENLIHKLRKWQQEKCSTSTEVNKKVERTSDREKWSKSWSEIESWIFVDETKWPVFFLSSFLSNFPLSMFSWDESFIMKHGKKRTKMSFFFAIFFCCCCSCSRSTKCFRIFLGKNFSLYKVKSFYQKSV